MLTLVAAVALALEQESHYVDASIAVDGLLLAAEFIDVDGDGRDEVVLAVRLLGGARELRVHDVSGDTIARAPRHTVRVLEDVIAWTFADVRPEPGRELVFLTRSGAFALDPRVERLRGNVARLVDTPLLFDVPNPLALPYWAYVVPAAGHENLLLPDRDGFAIFGPDPRPDAVADAAWVRLSEWPAIEETPEPSGEANGSADSQGDDEANAGPRRREARVGFSFGDDIEPFLGASSETTLASDGRSMRAPALVDIDGDGRRDLLLLHNNELHVHVAGPNGIAAVATRIEVLPSYLRRGKSRADLRLVDLDGDKRLDVLASWSAELDGFENVEWRLFVLFSAKDRLFPAEPNQVLRFEAAQVSVDVGRIDDDERPDLVVRTFALPGAIAAATGLTFEQTHLVYRGVRGGFEKKPLMRQSRTFDENGVREVIANRSMVMDCSGDGLGDLIEVALDGKIAIKRLRRESGFFTATTWQIDDAPWKTYATRGSVLSLLVEDRNGDGLGDIVSRGERGLTVLLSKRGTTR